jgi:glutamine amidotransferase
MLANKYKEVIYMCELFGVSSSVKLNVGEELKEFVSHSVDHPHGWGFAVFYENSASLEKEPIEARNSIYLQKRLKHKFNVQNMIGHIRQATVGTLDYENCHPYIKRDNYGRTWTLAHNGTIFDYQPLSRYISVQEGKTDSERILFYFVDKVDQKQEELGRALTEDERFELLEGLINKMSPSNKINLIFYDGDLMYVHTNYATTLYSLRLGETTLFATVPLDGREWKPMPFGKLCTYRNGKLVRKGELVSKEYFVDQQDLKYVYMGYAGL